MIVLVDADIYRYQFGSVEMAHPFAGYEDVPEDARVPASAEYICSLVDNSIKEVLEATGAKEYVCALSGEGNFRKKVAKQQPYKGNRDPNSSRPFHYDTVGDHIINNHPHVVVNGIEADDWLGITQRSDPGNHCIASRDKDLKGVHGYHYRFACGSAQPAVPMHWMSEEESLHFFFYQMLIGDNTDNIPGCGKKLWAKWGKTKIPCYNGEVLEVPHWMLRRKGVGDKSALKMLDGKTTAQELYDVVLDAYIDVFGTQAEEIMLEMARLLYIGQEENNLFTWDWLGITTSPVNNNVTTI